MEFFIGVLLGLGFGYCCTKWDTFLGIIWMICCLLTLGGLVGAGFVLAIDAYTPIFSHDVWMVGSLVVSVTVGGGINVHPRR